MNIKVSELVALAKIFHTDINAFFFRASSKPEKPTTYLNFLLVYIALSYSLRFSPTNPNRSILVYFLSHFLQPIVFPNPRVKINRKSAKSETNLSTLFAGGIRDMPKPKTSTGEKNLISQRLIELRRQHNYVTAPLSLPASAEWV